MMAKFLIVEARFYDHLNDLLLDGVRTALEDAGHAHETSLPCPARSRSPPRSRLRRKAAAMTAMSRWASSSAAKPIISKWSPTKARAASWR
jgi:hypothetical protein